MSIGLVKWVWHDPLPLLMIYLCKALSLFSKVVAQRSKRSHKHESMERKREKINKVHM